MTSYSFPEADRTHIGHPGRKEAADEGQNNLWSHRQVKDRARNKPLHWLLTQGCAPSPHIVHTQSLAEWNTRICKPAEVIIIIVRATSPLWVSLLPMSLCLIYLYMKMAQHHPLCILLHRNENHSSPLDSPKWISSSHFMILQCSHANQHSKYNDYVLNLLHEAPSVCVCVCVPSCSTLCDPIDCSPPGSSVHWLFQARLLEWAALSSSRGSSWSRDQTHLLYLLLGRHILYHYTTFSTRHLILCPYSNRKTTKADMFSLNTFKTRLTPKLILFLHVQIKRCLLLGRKVRTKEQT